VFVFFFFSQKLRRNSKVDGVPCVVVDVVCGCALLWWRCCVWRSCCVAGVVECYCRCVVGVAVVEKILAAEKV